MFHGDTMIKQNELYSNPVLRRLHVKKASDFAQVGPIADPKLYNGVLIFIQILLTVVSMQRTQIQSMLVTDKIRYLTLIDATKVWMPDTFFRNEKIGSFHNILAPNKYVRIYPNGDVLFSIR